MTYSKPENLTYTDMCIYIDTHVYEADADVNRIYEYIYHIVLMLSYKAKLFDKHRYYDPFAIYAASRIYMRYTNPKQYELNDDGSPKLDKIKSVLNYAKTMLYPLKVDFEQEEYSQILSSEVNTDKTYNYDNVVRDAVDHLLLVDFEATLGDVSKTCKHFLSSLPYPVKSKEWMNIYLSVMLTFLDSVTIKNKNLRRIKHLDTTQRLKQRHIEEFYSQERNKGQAVLFHLPESMNDYILVLSRQLRSIVAEDLKDILHTSIDARFHLAELVTGTLSGDTNEDTD